MLAVVRCENLRKIDDLQGSCDLPLAASYLPIILWQMAVDNEKTYWHLTPRGWLVGSYYEFRRCIEDVPVPLDRVLTGSDHVYQQSTDAPQERTWAIEWRSADNELVDRLEQLFGSRPTAALSG